MKIRKLLSLMLALMLVLSLAATAFAAENDEADETATQHPVTEAWITKAYNTVVGKALTFKFTAKQVTGNGYQDATATLTIEPISFTATDIGTTYRTSKLEFGGFTHSGIYKFTVSEVPTAYNSADDTTGITLGTGEAIHFSSAKYTVEAYVEKNEEGKFEVVDIVVMSDEETKVADISNPDDDNDGDNKAKRANAFLFENTYVYEAGRGDPNPTDPSNPDPDDTTTYDNSGSFKLDKKTVTPTDGDYTADSTEFSFTVTFSFPAGTSADSLGGIKIGENSVSLKADNSTTVTLKSGESNVFTGLPAGTTVTVTEAAAENYKAASSVKMNDGDAVETATTTYATAHTASGTLGVNSNLMTFTNTRLSVPTTGVILNVLPFVLLIALAGGVLFLMIYTKRRKTY